MQEIYNLRTPYRRYGIPEPDSWASRMPPSSVKLIARVGKSTPSIAVPNNAVGEETSAIIFQRITEAPASLEPHKTHQAM